MSPANFLATNPDAQNRLIESGGESLRAGVRNMLEDLTRGKISQTDETAFEVGRNVAATEGAVVYENEFFQLLQYKPLTDKVYARPLLLVPPCINKFYILDLQPESSLVRHAVEQGHTVFLVSWRNPDASMAERTWDDYIEHAAIRAIEVARDISGEDKINVLGFCVGGTILSTALAVLASRGEHPAASLTLLTTLLDFRIPASLTYSSTNPTSSCAKQRSAAPRVRPAACCAAWNWPIRSRSCVRTTWSGTTWSTII